jgi:hypothetical protein
MLRSCARFENMLKLTLDISIDGDTAVAFTENVEQRYLAYGWQVLHVRDGDQLNLAILTRYPLSNFNAATWRGSTTRLSRHGARRTSRP